MIPCARPIKLMHVSAFDRSRSLWSRCITHASDYRSLQKRLQLPSGNPHGIRHNSPEMVSSAHLCGSVSTASPLSSVVSPSRTSVGPFTPPLNLLHRTAMLSLRRARRIRSFLCARASHPPLSFPPPTPPFFAPARRIRPFLCPPPSPPPHTMQVALHPRSFCLSMCSTSFPVPAPSPIRGVHSSLFHFLRHLPASAVNLPLSVAAHRVLFEFALLTIAWY